MLQQHSLSEQSRFSKLFATLRIEKALRNAGISKSFGLSSLAIFRIVFSLIFKEKNWFRLLESDQGAYLPGKDVVYLPSSSITSTTETKEEPDYFIKK
ncbi:hypothetical protein AV545_10190 [Paenibacillus jamilae]|nr:MULTISPECIES: hypothetical protein [Paenibacillus]KZE77807.1 hypothetical protein AV545_10190 [Paenibacillus jamilae]